MTEWIKQAATQILPLAASGICNDEDGNVKPTADVIEEIIHDAYMDRDGELRDLLCCPPDCDLTSWAKRMGNFWHDLEGGQVVESLKQQLAEANVEQIAKDHRVMEAWWKVIDSNLGVLVSVSGPPLTSAWTSVWEVWCMDCANMIANGETSDPADAIIAAEAARKD
jgi:hypothetical protein